MDELDSPLRRSEIFPESELPDAAGLIAEGRGIAKRISVGPSTFLSEKNVSCEIEYKRRQMAEGVIMLHAQIGYRSLAKSRRAYSEIYERTSRAGHGVDRFGICLDWSMGYPARARRDMPRGTGLILDQPEDFARLTAEAPAAPHFGDFVIGMPSAVENTEAALAAGSTAIGNLGQYFNFRLPYWTDDLETTTATLKALALAAAQPVAILIHSNLDDGFAAQFHDVASALGAVLLERYIVEELIGGQIGHCYGHTYSQPMTRLAFQQALASVSQGPGTMIYGNTTVFGPEAAENYANLAGYLLVDIAAQRNRATGHAVNPVPVTEALRIPEIEEVIDAHFFCLRLIDRTEILEPLLDLDAAHDLARRIENGGRRFKEAVLAGFAEAQIDTSNPFEMLLAIKRIGARRLERLFGPGAPHPELPGVPVPIVKASSIAELEAKAQRCLDGLGEDQVRVLRSVRLSGCIATTDVHEYGKLLVEAVLSSMDMRIIDAGVSTDPDVLVKAARDGRVDFIAISTYNGVALDYMQRLRRQMEEEELAIPVFIGGKLNQILDDSQTSMPVDVSGELESSGAVVCRRVEDLLERLVVMAKEKRQPGDGQ